jgi:hypothetical protein
MGKQSTDLLQRSKSYSVLDHLGKEEKRREEEGGGGS